VDHTPAPAWPSSRSVWVVALVAGLAAGLGAWAGGEAYYPQRFREYYNRTPEMAKMDRVAVEQEMTRQMQATKPPAEMKNTAITYGMLGGLLGLTLGIAGGWLSGRAPRAVIGGVIGLVLAGAVGASLFAAVVPVFYRRLDPESGLGLMLMTRGLAWTGLGAAAGLGFGLGLGGTRAIVAGLVGGLVGAFLGSIAFEVFNSLLFPVLRAYEPIPGNDDAGLPRLLAHLLIAGFTAFGVAYAIVDQRPKARA
jgi:hypothetical protein